MAVRKLTASLLLIVPVVLAASQSVRPTAPESFRAQGQILATGGGIAAEIAIQIDRYTPEAEHAALAKVLREDGYTAFVAKLKAAPAVGALKAGGRSIPIRWAREQPQGDGRRIAVVTEAPVLFVGAGAVNAKPTEGFDVAIVEFTVDSVGLGKGSMAPAARVKAGGPNGVQVDDYAGKPVTLNSVARDHS